MILRLLWITLIGCLLYSLYIGWVLYSAGGTIGYDPVTNEVVYTIDMKDIRGKLEETK